MTATPDIARLKNFFAGYFHEDWAEDAADVDTVLEQFFNEGWTGTELRALSEDITAYVVLRDDDTLATSLFQELGCYYDPSADGHDTRAWLKGVASSLSARAVAAS